MRERIETLLRILGGNDRHLGFQMAAALIELCIIGGDIFPLSKKGYPLLCGKVGKSANTVEKDIQNFIRALWQTGDADAIGKMFLASVDENSGSPGNKQFILTLAERIRFAE